MCILKKKADPQLLIQLYTSTRNEMIARIQQRDQYMICIIGSFIAFWAGYIDYIDATSGQFPWWCVIFLLLQCYLTYRQYHSYKLYTHLVDYISGLETQLNSLTLIKPDMLWQQYIEKHYGNHRKQSMTASMRFYIILIMITFAFFINCLLQFLVNRNPTTSSCCPRFFL